MDYQAIINQYYPEENKLKHILLVHSRSVANKALAIVDQHPELHINRQFRGRSCYATRHRYI